MIDVHHTILPLTARPKPDAAAMIAASLPLADGLRILAPADMIVHSAAHLFADGDLAGGLRNLWDIDRLLRAFAPADPDFWQALENRAALHGLSSAVHRAARLANDLYETPVPESWRVWDSADPLFKARLLARDGWGRPTRSALRLAFYVRSHWIRMPPAMLARHLLTKARR
jgi:phytoene dehydrogenase-like protein